MSSNKIDRRLTSLVKIEDKVQTASLSVPSSLVVQVRCWEPHCLIGENSGRDNSVVCQWKLFLQGVEENCR